MRTYETLKDQNAAAQKKLEMRELTYESAKKKRELGTYSDENVLDAEKALNQPGQRRRAAADALENGKNDLIMMLGWSYGSDPEILSVPEPDLTRSHRMIFRRIRPRLLRITQRCLLQE